MSSKTRLLVLLGSSEKFKRIITPTLGTEILADPGLEAAYVGGLCSSLIKSGSPTVEEETTDIHGGSKAQKFTAVANNNSVYVDDGTANPSGWYRGSAWYKRTAGTTDLCKMVLTGTKVPNVASEVPITTGNSWNYYESNMWLTTGSNIYLFHVSRETGGVYDTIIIDDTSIKPITTSSMMAKPKAHSENAIVQASVTVPTTNTFGGVAMNVDSITNPLNYVVGFVFQIHGVNCYCVLAKIVGGVITQLIATAVVYVAGAPIRVVNSGETYQLFYNGTQVGTDQTISDAGIRSGRIATQFASSPSVIFSGYEIP